MLTIGKLRVWGANVDEGLTRCMKNESFYLMLVNKMLSDPAFENLKEGVESGNLDQAFEAAHSLKGMTANLSLTPILLPVQKITDLLRGRVAMDYSPLLQEIISQRDQLIRLSQEQN